jgi:hypothetical protein
VKTGAAKPRVLETKTAELPKGSRLRLVVSKGAAEPGRPRASRYTGEAPELTDRERG